MQAGKLQLLGMLGRQLGFGDPPAGGLDRLGQGLDPRLSSRKTV